MMTLILHYYYSTNFNQLVRFLSPKQAHTKELQNNENPSKPYEKKNSRLIRTVEKLARICQDS